MQVHLTNQHFLLKIQAFLNKLRIVLITLSGIDGPVSVNREYY